MFVDEFYIKSYFKKLVEAIRKDPDEQPEDISCACYCKKLVLYHLGYARKRHKRETTSEFRDFEVLSIYNCEPTIQDQLTYIGVMCEIFKDKNYYEKAYEYWDKKDVNILEKFKSEGADISLGRQNRFFIDRNNGFDENRIIRLKHNNIFVLNTLEYLMLRDGDVNELDKDYYDTIVNMNLPVAGNMNNCHEKLRFLVLSLHNQDNRTLFMESALITCVMRPLLAGYTRKEDRREAWVNYSNKANSTDEICKKSPFRGGLFVYRQSDKTFPIGLDFSAMLDIIVSDDGNGKYCLISDVCREIKEELLKATQMQIDLLKNSERFKNNFYHLDFVDDGE